MKEETRKKRYQKEAIRALAWYIRCGYSMKKIAEDGRAGSCHDDRHLIYSIGNLMTTSPKNPAVNIMIKRDKVLAVFTLKELAAEARAYAKENHVS